MDKQIEKWLYDIKLAIKEIDEFMISLPKKNFSAYKSNKMLKRAIERELEIIGEAVNRILKKDPKIIKTIPESESIVGLRNHIIHSYDSISDENIWAVLINHLPVLKKQVLFILEEK